MSSDSTCSEVDTDTRRGVLARDRHTCQMCGRVGERLFPDSAPDYQDEPVILELHHKVPATKGGTNSPRNLITLCQRDHRSRHHNPAPQITDDDGEPIPNPAVVKQASGLSDPESTEAEIYATVARHGPVRTGQIAEVVELSDEHARRLLYRLGARDLVVPTRDEGWDITERVQNPPIGELPDTPRLAATRVRDELLRRGAEWGIDDADLAEIADVSPRTVRVAIDRAATYDTPLPDDADWSASITDSSDDQATLEENGLEMND